MIECTAFVYKHILCSNGELIIGNNGYEIIYKPKPFTEPNIYNNNTNSTKDPDVDVMHRITIDWDTISGLKRTNKDIDNNNFKLIEQLIIESTCYPQLHAMQYNPATDTYETQSIELLRTHYIGLEYDIIHSHRINTSLLHKYASYSVLFNTSLPEWIWIPLLNHNLRKCIQNLILFGNIALFIWTIYQITKYTSIIQTFYVYIFYPLFNYISQTMLRKMYYFLNLMQFHVVLQFMSTIFSFFYNYIPINFLYKIISFFDQHIIQQIIGLFAMFYKLFHSLFSLFLPLFNAIFSLFEQLTFNCFLCNKLSTMCRKLTFMCNFIRKCLTFCRQSQVVKDSGKILKVGVNGVKTIKNRPSNGLLHYIWNNLKLFIDAFWFGIGKPIKHIYDFFRYIRSEAGIVVGKCIRKCCKKSREKVKNVIRTPMRTPMPTPIPTPKKKHK